MKKVIILFLVSIYSFGQTGKPQAIDNMATPLFKGMILRKQALIPNPSIGIQIANTGGRIVSKDSLGVITQYVTSNELEPKFDINNTVFISPLRIDRLLRPVIIAGQPTTWVAENVVQISQATTSQSGFLSATDWNAFNSKLSTATAANTYAPIVSPTFTGTVSGINKAMVGLGNVDNTSDLSKPISTATQLVLNSKLDTLMAKNNYAQLAKNNIFTGSNTFANNTTSNDYSKIKTEWSGNSTLARFMLKYETRAGGQTIFRTPLTFDYNGWVGIGKESPTVPLDVSGSGKFSSDLSTFTLGSSSKTILAANEGNVGIGIGSPTEKLDVVGNIKASGTILGSNLSGTNTGDNAVNSLYSGLATSKLDVVVATNTYMPLSGGTFVGNVNYSPLFSQSINADASSTEYQRFKWYVYNPNGNTTAGAESKLVLQTIRRAGPIGIKNNIVVDNGKVGINIDDLDNEPSKSLTVGGDMKITGQPFVNTSLFDYNEGNYLKVASGGGIIGENLDLKFLTNNNAIANYARLGSNNSFSGQNTFLNPVLATSIDASGAVSALSYSSTTGANFATSSGNVGIGTASPSTALHLYKSATTPIPLLRLETAGVGGRPHISFKAEGIDYGFVGWGSSNNKLYFSNFTNSDTEFATNNATRVIIKNNGNFLIGTPTDSGYKLDVNGTTRIKENAIFESNVGIGTASPLTALHLYESATTPIPLIRLETIGTSGRPYIDFRAEGLDYGFIGYGSNSNKLFISNRRDADTEFTTNNSTRVIIKNNGNFLIGTTSDVGYKLDVNGATRISGNLGIGTGSSIPTATLDVNGYAKLRAYTTAEINAIASPTQGMVAYNSTIAALCFYDGTAWKKVTHSNM